MDADEAFEDSQAVYHIERIAPIARKSGDEGEAQPAPQECSKRERQSEVIGHVRINAHATKRVMDLKLKEYFDRKGIRQGGLRDIVKAGFEEALAEKREKEKNEE